MTPSMIKTHGPHSKPRRPAGAAVEGEPIDARAITTPMPMEAENGGGLRFISYLQYHWLSIFLVGGMISAALAYLAWELVPSKYTSYALIRVSMADEAVFENKGNNRGDFAIYLKTQSQIVKSQRVLMGALRDQAVAELPMLKGQEDPVRFLEEELKVEFTEGSEIIKLGLSGEDPQAITKVLNAIHQAYFKLEVEEETKKRNDNFLRLESMLQREEAALNSKYEALNSAEEAGPLPVKDDEPIKQGQIAAAQLLRLRESLFKVDGDISAQKRRIEFLNYRLKNPPEDVLNPPPAQLPTAVQQATINLDNDPEVKELERKIEAVQSKIDYLVKLSGDANTPVIQRYRASIREYRASQEKIKQAKLASLTPANTPTPNPMQAQNYLLQQYRSKMMFDLDHAKVVLADLEETKIRTEKAIDTLMASIPKTPEEHEAETPDLLRTDIKHREAMVGRLKDKVNVARIEVQTQPRVRLLQPAVVPQKREFKKQLVATAGAGMMGFAIIGLVAVLYESRVRRVMALKDVRQAARGPVLGVIPALPTAQPGKARNFAAMTALNEAIDKTRTLTMQHAAQSSHKTVMITSALEDEGKAFLTWQLTLSFVKSGCRTLLIDFDLRQPAMHDYFGVPNEKGMCEVLRGEADLRNSIQTFSDGLCFLAAGKWTDQVRQELVGDKIALTLARVREHFDCIILHTTPLLTVTDSYLVAQQADMVILSTLKHNTRLPMIDHAQERILQSGAGFYGVVFLGASDEEALC